MRSYLSLIPISARVRRQQNRMTLLCIVISVFLVTAIFSVAETFTRTEEQIMRDKHGSWHIQITDLSPDLADGISRRPDVTVMGWWDRINFDASQPYYIGERRAALYGTDEAYLVQLMNGVEEGNFPQRDDEVVLNSEAKIALDVGIGDRVTVCTPAGDAEFTVSGFGTDDSDYYKGQTFMVAVYMTRNAFHTLMAQNGLSESPVCTIQFQSAEKASKARAELQESGGVPKETILENKAVMGIAGQSDNEAISGIYVIAIFLFLLVMAAGVLMISGSLNSSIAQRTQFFGMMRCIGASRRQVMRFVRLEALSWCKTAVPCGLAAGILVSWGICAYLRFGIGGEEFSVMPVISFSPLGILGGVLVGVVTVYLSAQAPAKKAARVSPVMAVSGNAELPESCGHAMTLRSRKIESALGIHHATGSRKNWFLMTASYALSIILFLCFSVGLSFARGLLPSQRAYQPDIALNGYANALVIEQDIADKIRGISGVEYAYGSSYLRDIPVTSSNPEIDHIHLESYDDALLELVKESVAQGNLSGIFGDSNEVITILNKDNPLKMGDTIQIGEEELQITCTLSSSIFPSKCLIICSQETFARLTGEQNYTMIGIRLNPQADDSTLKEINKLVESDVIFGDQRESNRSDNSTFMAVQAAFYGFLAIIGMITLFYTMNSISISTVSRAKQYGAMRAVGISNRQLSRMISAEALTYAASGLIAGCGIGIPLSRFLYLRIVTRYFGTLWQLPIITLCIIIVFVFSCSVISVYAPTKRICGMAIVDTINEL